MVYKLLLLLLFITPALAVEDDMEDPSGPGDYRSAFFGADFRGLATNAYENWIEPGDEFCRAKYFVNCDGTPATPAQVSGARTTWGNMAQCNRWRIRLHHEGLTFVHDAQPKIEVQYYTGIPASRRDQIIGCLVQDEFEFLGFNKTQVCQKLNQRQAGLCSRFMPNDTMPTVIYGWESDAQ